MTISDDEFPSLVNAIDRALDHICAARPQVLRQRVDTGHVEIDVVRAVRRTRQQIACVGTIQVDAHLIAPDDPETAGLSGSW